ncbi:MAG: histidine phosphatase family protein [Alphaproteobacteria bacterium]|nr:histidine phosphatase family protein [Alphaproteobacteria bacterium]
MQLALIRHGPTEWNAQGRIQGRIDTPLSAEGRAKMAALAIPQSIRGPRAFTSPQLRARETAALLGLNNAIADARLAEHHWGKWEGMTRAEILARDGEDAFIRAGLGADFHPPGGESTRALIARVQSFLTDIAKQDGNAVAVSHRGVLRTAYALATGWDMKTPMPAALDLETALVLDIAPDGEAKIVALNVPLIARTASVPKTPPIP